MCHCIHGVGLLFALSVVKGCTFVVLSDIRERYRDLISAADTIKQMKLCAEKVSMVVSSDLTMSALCSNIQYIIIIINIMKKYAYCSC